MGPSEPHNMIALGQTIRPSAIVRSQERGITEDAHRLSRNVFNQLGRSRREDIHTHLKARCTSATSRMRGEELVVSLVNDEINELRARLEKLAARNTEAAHSTSTLPFSAEIQQPPLPTGFRMPTDPLDHLDTFSTTRWICYRSQHLLAAGVSQLRCRGHPRNGSVK